MAVIGSWNGSPPMLVMDFVKKLNKRTMYCCENDPMSGSSYLPIPGAVKG
jgi:hypothetical protein